jgi:hypothetical protein
MMLVNRRDANIPYSHLFRADRSIVSIALFHNLLELFVIFPDHDAGRRGRNEGGGIDRCDFVHVGIAGEGFPEKLLVPFE